MSGYGLFFLDRREKWTVCGGVSGAVAEMEKWRLLSGRGFLALPLYFLKWRGLRLL
jgi:hypothetical protein